MSGGGGGSTENEYTRAQGKISNEMYADYQQTYRPVESTLINKVTELGTDAAMERSSGNAVAETGLQFAKQRGALERSLTSYGVDPSSGKYAGKMASMGLAEASASAANGNAARANQRAQYISGLQNIVSVGRGVQASASSGLASAGQQQSAADSAARAAKAQGEASAGAAVGTGIMVAVMV